MLTRPVRAEERPLRPEPVRPDSDDDPVATPLTADRAEAAFPVAACVAFAISDFPAGARPQSSHTPSTILPEHPDL